MRAGDLRWTLVGWCMGNRTRIVALPTVDDTIFAELPTPSLRLAVLGPLRSVVDNS